MSDKTENQATIYAYPGSLIYTDKAVKNTVEYIRADLLNDEGWLAEHGLRKFCKLCGGKGEVAQFERWDGKTFLIGYDPCECIATIEVD